MTNILSLLNDLGDQCDNLSSLLEIEGLRRDGEEIGKLSERLIFLSESTEKIATDTLKAKAFRRECAELYSAVTDIRGYKDHYLNRVSSDTWRNTLDSIANSIRKINRELGKGE